MEPNGKKILVVEDNEINLKLLRALLQIKGYEILEKTDAKDIVETVRSFRPDLILMDLALPGIDGITATRFIKSEPDLKDIPVVAITAHVFENYRRLCFEEGFEGFIEKPIDKKEFLAEIERFLNKYKGAY